MATSGDLGEYVRFTMGQATNDTIDRIQTDMSSSSITQACQTGMTTFLGDLKKGLPYTYQGELHIEAETRLPPLGRRHF